MSDIPDVIDPANVQNYPRKYIDEIGRLRAEVARVTELAITERDSGAAEIERLTARLAKVTEERNQWRRVCLAQDRIGIKRALSARKVARAYRQLDAEAFEWMLKAMKQAAETGAARLEAERWKNAAMGENVKHALAIDEVARLRELIERKAGALTVFSQHTGLSTGMCIQWRHEFDAALRGDTAPAQQAGTNVVSLNSLNECDTCGHLMVDHDRTDDGRRVCMRLGCNCLEPAPAGGEAK